MCGLYIESTHRHSVRVLSDGRMLRTTFSMMAPEPLMLSFSDIGEDRISRIKARKIVSQSASTIVKDQRGGNGESRRSPGNTVRIDGHGRE